MGRLDKSLDRLLTDLAERLGASRDDRILVQPDDLVGVGPEGVEILCHQGLLVPDEPARMVICDGCDRGCVMEVALAAGLGRATSRAFVVCDKRDDIGRVPVDAERLRRWQFPLERIAGVLAKLLDTDREPRRGVQSLVWDLGTIGSGKERVEVALASMPTGSKARHGLIVALCALDASEGAAIDLASLVRFRNHQPQLNRMALRRALSARFNDSQIAWEIKFEGGEVVLFNHVTGRPTTIASPNLNSTNDNAFQILFSNPGRTFSLAELRNEARDPTIADLHKMVENLRFRGDLKRAFFRVSKGAVRFERTATLGRLATLGIDPRSEH